MPSIAHPCSAKACGQTACVERHQAGAAQAQITAFVRVFARMCLLIPKFELDNFHLLKYLSDAQVPEYSLNAQIHKRLKKINVPMYAHGVFCCWHSSVEQTGKAL
jgi:hypothetical protein